MKLMTKAIEKTIPQMGSTEGTKGDRKVACKFFTPDGNWTWYVLEGEKTGEDWYFFGLVEGMETELGYFLLSELESTTGPLGLHIERDMWLGDKTLQEVSPEFCERLWGDK